MKSAPTNRSRPPMMNSGTNSSTTPPATSTPTMPTAAKTAGPLRLPTNRWVISVSARYIYPGGPPTAPAATLAQPVARSSAFMSTSDLVSISRAPMYRRRVIGTMSRMVTRLAASPARAPQSTPPRASKAGPGHKLPSGKGPSNHPRCQGFRLVDPCGSGDEVKADDTTGQKAEIGPRGPSPT